MGHRLHKRSNIPPQFEIEPGQFVEVLLNYHVASDIRASSRLSFFGAQSMLNALPLEAGALLEIRYHAIV